MHWGVFELADEALDAPPRGLREEIQRQGVDVNRYTAEKIGAFIPFPRG